MLGFGEGEGREKEKREERQSFFLRLRFFLLRFLSGFRKGFSLLIYLFIFIYVFFNTVLMWKIVGVLEKEKVEKKRSEERRVGKEC